MYSPVTGLLPLMEKLKFGWSMVRQSEMSVLKEASTSQFLTRFSTKDGRLAATWFWVLAGLEGQLIGLAGRGCCEGD
jgi:hypothetical protein